MTDKCQTHTGSTRELLTTRRQQASHYSEMQSSAEQLASHVASVNVVTDRYALPTLRHSNTTRQNTPTKFISFASFWRLNVPWDNIRGGGEQRTEWGRGGGNVGIQQREAIR